MKKRTFKLISIIIVMLLIILIIKVSVSEDRSEIQSKIEKPLKSPQNLNASLIIKPKLSSSDWEVYWSDEFDGQEINHNYWNIQQGGDIWGNNEMQYYTQKPQNCRIENGKLIIAGQKKEYNGKLYTSARIDTKGKVDFFLGKIEIKAKLPQGQGLLPAFWMMPSQETYSKRRKNGEIDIMEMLGNDPKVVYGVAHFLNKKKSKASYKYECGEDLSKDFHIYALEWNQSQLKWLLDNHVYYSLDLEKTFRGEFNPFSKNFYLIMNLAIGGNWPGKIIDEKFFPAVMQIDYVRYYRKKF